LRGFGGIQSSEFEGLLQDTTSIDSVVARRIIDSTDRPLARDRDSGASTVRNATVIEPKWIPLLHRQIIWRFFGL
jgi:hypothetical protein